MNRFLACGGVLGLAALGLLILSPVVACTNDPADAGAGDASAADAADTGSPSTGDASDSGDTNPLGFKPSNTDTATALAAALAAADLGDLNLSDCGPEL